MLDKIVQSAKALLYLAGAFTVVVIGMYYMQSVSVFH